LLLGFCTVGIFISCRRFCDTKVTGVFLQPGRDQPVHVHVEKDEKYAKFWLDPPSVARSRGFRDHELNEISGIIEENAEMLEAKWHEFFGR